MYLINRVRILGMVSKNNHIVNNITIIHFTDHVLPSYYYPLLRTRSDGNLENLSFRSSPGNVVREENVNPAKLSIST